MLNGKKSYLVSFTALFSKKGYKLAFGINNILEINNQHHLTAPVNSTYRALREDMMKTADKVPHSATGMFGKLSKQAENLTEYDCTQMETVTANVVIYLDAVHKHLSSGTNRNISDTELDEHVEVERADLVIDGEVEIAKEGNSSLCPVSYIIDETILAEHRAINTDVVKSIEVSIQPYTTITDASVSAISTTAIKIVDGYAVRLGIIGELPNRDADIVSRSTEIKVDNIDAQPEDVDFWARLLNNIIDAEYTSIEDAWMDRTEEVVIEGADQGAELIAKHSAGGIDTLSYGSNDNKGMDATVEEEDTADDFLVSKEGVVPIISKASSERSVDFVIHTFSEGVHSLTNQGISIGLNLAMHAKDSYALDDKIESAISSNNLDGVLSGWSVADNIKQTTATVPEASYGKYGKTSTVISVVGGIDQVESIKSEYFTIDYLESGEQHKQSNGIVDQGVAAEHSLYGNAAETHSIELSRDVSIYNDARFAEFESGNSDNTFTGKNVSLDSTEEMSVTVDESNTDNFMAGEMIREQVLNHPDIMQTARLMKIMYGSKAIEIIEAGIEMIIKDGVIENVNMSDTTETITQTVIETLKEVTTGSNMDGILENIKQANETAKNNIVYVDVPDAGLVPSKDNIAELAEPINGLHPQAAAYTYDDSLELGNRNYTFGDGIDTGELSKAVKEANARLGVLVEDTQATREDPASEGLLTEMGTGLPDTNVYDGVSDHIDSGSVEDKHEDALVDYQSAADTERELDAVSESMTESDWNKELDVINHPEIMQIARLMKIMHGSKAIEIIEAGIEMIIKDGVMENVNMADTTETITQTVIETLKEVTLGSNMDGILEYTKQANEITKNNIVYVDVPDAGLVSSKDNIAELAEPINGLHPQAAAYTYDDLLELGNRNYTFGDGIDTGELSKAVKEANARLGVLVEDTQATREDPASEGLLTEMGTGLPDTNVYDGVNDHIDSGRVDDKHEDALVNYQSAADTERELVAVSESATESDWNKELDVIGTEDLDTARHFTSHRAVIVNGDNAYSDYKHSDIITNQETATSESEQWAVNFEIHFSDDVELVDGGVVEEIAGADSILFDRTTEIVDISESIRKKKVLLTDREDDSDGTRVKKRMEIRSEDQEEAFKARKQYEIVTEKDENAVKKNKGIEIDTQEGVNAERERRTIEVNTELGSDGTNETVPIAPKRKVWIIMGKLATWSKWNWKKTR